MKRILYLCAALLFVLCVRTAPVHAFGLGLYGSFDGGKMIWGGYGEDFMNYGGGFVMDTNLAGNQVFNYRMELGFSNLRTSFRVDELDFSQTLLYSLLLGSFLPMRTEKTYYENTLAINMVHYFGFGVVRTKHVRFWLGPQITIGGMLTNLTGFFAGIGFAMGLNINIGDVFTLSITGAGRFLGGVEFYTVEGVTYDKGGYGGDGMVTMAFIFRIPGDKYK